MQNKNLEFSFSGLKTSLLYFIDNTKIYSKHDVAASYQAAIIDVLITKLKWAMEKTDCKTCVIAGGVASNQVLRKLANQTMKNKKVIFPELSLCTDNAAMIAYLGEIYLQKGIYSPIDFPILPNMKLV